MAEISRFWTTNGVGDGPSTEYTSNNFSSVLAATFGSGVLARIGDELTCYDMIHSGVIWVNFGAAIVAGRFYRIPSGVIELPMPDPLVANTGIRVVLRADWALNTVRAHLKVSTNGNPEPPGVTQNYGVQWEITLCTGIILDSFNYVTYDDKDRAEYSMSLADESVGSRELGLAAVTTPKFHDGAVTEDKILGFPQGWDGNITTEKLAENAVNYLKVAPNTITDAKLAPGALLGNLYFLNESVTRPKVGVGGLRLAGRQGGNSLDFSAPGEINYQDDLKVDIQIGATYYYMTDGWNMAIATAQLHRLFADDSPLVIASVESEATVGVAGGGTRRVYPQTFCYVMETTRSEIRFAVVHPRGIESVADSGTVYWMAIGNGRSF